MLNENLKTIRLWLEENAQDGGNEKAYEASACLQCGLCLEVCPNFISGGTFAGMASAVPMARIFAKLPEETKGERGILYDKHIYEGCGKSLACRNICPAGIDIEKMLASSNSAAVWRRIFRRKDK